MTFPSYRVSSTRIDGQRCTVEVWALTRCGPRITAKSTVYAKKRETLEELEATAKSVAVRNLGHEHDEVVARCIKKGEHESHG